MTSWLGAIIWVVTLALAGLCVGRGDGAQAARRTKQLALPHSMLPKSPYLPATRPQDANKFKCKPKAHKQRLQAKARQPIR